jgi:hypothetical protein
MAPYPQVARSACHSPNNASRADQQTPYNHRIRTSRSQNRPNLIHSRAAIGSQGATTNLSVGGLRWPRARSAGAGPPRRPRRGGGVHFDASIDKTGFAREVVSHLLGDLTDLLEDAAIGETQRRRGKRMARIVRGFLDDYRDGQAAVAGTWISDHWNPGSGAAHAAWQAELIGRDRCFRSMPRSRPTDEPRPSTTANGTRT